MELWRRVPEWHLAWPAEREKKEFRCQEECQRPPGDEQELLATTKQPVSQDFSRPWLLACAPDLTLQESTSAPGLALRPCQCFRHQVPVSGECLTPEAHHLSTCFLN